MRSAFEEEGTGSIWEEEFGGQGWGPWSPSLLISAKAVAVGREKKTPKELPPRKRQRSYFGIVPGGF